jgi:hypothetical protein
MARKHHDVCSDVIDLVLDDEDVLVWDNTHGTHDCKVTGCRPALQLDCYTIPAGQTRDANTANVSDQKYHCDCGHDKRSDPRLKVQ